jgi:hypothetical protein
VVSYAHDDDIIDDRRHRRRAYGLQEALTKASNISSSAVDRLPPLHQPDPPQ